MDDLCQLNEDENCQQRDFLNVAALLLACLAITVLAGEAVVRYLKSRKMECDLELDSENPTAMISIRKFLNEFFSNHSTSKLANKLFKVTLFI